MGRLWDGDVPFLYWSGEGCSPFGGGSGGTSGSGRMLGRECRAPFRVVRVFRGSTTDGEGGPRNTRKDTKRGGGAARVARRLVGAVAVHLDRVGCRAGNAGLPFVWFVCFVVQPPMGISNHERHERTRKGEAVRRGLLAVWMGRRPNVAAPWMGDGDRTSPLRGIGVRICRGCRGRRRLRPRPASLRAGFPGNRGGGVPTRGGGAGSR